jgi:hypothetical protein
MKIWLIQERRKVEAKGGGKATKQWPKDKEME